MLALLRRLLAILLLLSVQWSTLGGALVACADMDSGTGAADVTYGTDASGAEGPRRAMPAHEPAGGMADMQGMRGDERGRPVHDRQEGGASPLAAPCCAPDAPRPGNGPDAPSGGCVLMATCMTPMMPAPTEALRLVRVVAAAMRTTDDLAPPTLSSPPDAPPPRA